MQFHSARTPLGDSTLRVIEADQAYDVRVVRAHNRILVYRDRSLEGIALDGALIAGKVGFGSQGARVTFDDLVAY